MPHLLPTVHHRQSEKLCWAYVEVQDALQGGHELSCAGSSQSTLIAAQNRASAQYYTTGEGRLCTMQTPADHCATWQTTACSISMHAMHHVVFTVMYACQRFRMRGISTMILAHFHLRPDRLQQIASHAHLLA